MCPLDRDPFYFKLKLFSFLPFFVSFFVSFFLWSVLLFTDRRSGRIDIGDGVGLGAVPRRGVVSGRSPARERRPGPVGWPEVGAPAQGGWHYALLPQRRRKGRAPLLGDHLWEGLARVRVRVRVPSRLRSSVTATTCGRADHFWPLWAFLNRLWPLFGRFKPLLAVDSLMSSSWR
jgi:hypothetical protein